jgi:hypothetical protein
MRTVAWLQNEIDPTVAARTLARKIGTRRRLLREKEIGTSGAQTGVIRTGEEEHGVPRLDCGEEKPGALNGNRSRRRWRKGNSLREKMPRADTKNRNTRSQSLGRQRRDCGRDRECGRKTETLPAGPNPNDRRESPWRRARDSASSGTGPDRIA